MKSLLAALLLTTLLHAQTPAPATRTLPIPCPTVESIARPFFSQRSFILLPEVNCPTCFISKTSDLHDDANHHVSASRLMHLYIQPDQAEKVEPHRLVRSLQRRRPCPPHPHTRRQRLPRHPPLHLQLVRSPVPHRHPRRWRGRNPPEQSPPRKSLPRPARKDHATTPALISRSALRPPKYPNSAM